MFRGYTDLLASVAVIVLDNVCGVMVKGTVHVILATILAMVFVEALANVVVLF